tara:strand:- start:656 stop:874 length:219 start_codon:yes stop_codon:yes gene_type:complete
MEKTISKKARRNINILRKAIENGDSVRQTMKRLKLDIPINSNVSFMVRDGKFISLPMQLDLFEGGKNDNSKT